MLNPMVVPITMVRKGLDGSALNIPIDQLLYSGAFAISSLFIGILVFKYFESKVVKYL